MLCIFYITKQIVFDIDGARLNGDLSARCATMSATMILTDLMLYQMGSYSDDVGPWNKGALVQGVNYTESITLNNLLTPVDQTFAWQWPTQTVPTVRSFLSVNYGNYDFSNFSSPVVSSTIANLNALSESHAFSLSGDLAGFNVIDDLFLTRAAGGNNARAAEVEVFVHTPASTQQWLSSLP